MLTKTTLMALTTALALLTANFGPTPTTALPVANDNYRNNNDDDSNFKCHVYRSEYEAAAPVSVPPTRTTTGPPRVPYFNLPIPSPSPSHYRYFNGDYDYVPYDGPGGFVRATVTATPSTSVWDGIATGVYYPTVNNGGGRPEVVPTWAVRASRYPLPPETHTRPAYLRTTTYWYGGTAPSQTMPAGGNNPPPMPARTPYHYNGGNNGGAQQQQRPFGVDQQNSTQFEGENGVYYNGNDDNSVEYEYEYDGPDAPTATFVPSPPTVTSRFYGNGQTEDEFCRPSGKVQRYIGIDLREDSFAVGYVNSAGKVELIPNENGGYYTPAHVRFINRGHKALVGLAALEENGEEGLNTEKGDAPVVDLSEMKPEYMDEWYPEDVLFSLGRDRASPDGAVGFSYASRRLVENQEMLESDKIMLSEHGPYRQGGHILAVILKRAIDMAERHLSFAGEKVDGIAMTTQHFSNDVEDALYKDGMHIADRSMELDYGSMMLQTDLFDFYPETLSLAAAHIQFFESRVQRDPLGGEDAYLPQTVLFYNLRGSTEDMKVMQYIKGTFGLRPFHLKALAYLPHEDGLIQEEFERYLMKSLADQINEIRGTTGQLETPFELPEIPYMDKAQFRRATFMMDLLSEGPTSGANAYKHDDVHVDLWLGPTKMYSLSFSVLKQIRFNFMKERLSKAVDRVLAASGLEGKDMVDHLVVADMTLFKGQSTAAMEAVFGEEGKKKIVKAVDPQRAVAEGIATIAGILTKESPLQFVVKQFKKENKEAVEMEMGTVQASFEAVVQTMEDSNDIWYIFLPFPNPSSPEQEDREAQFYLDATKYVPLTHKNWKAFESDFLKRRLVLAVDNLLKQAQEVHGGGKSNGEMRAVISIEAVDHLIVMDKTRFRFQSTTALEKAVLGARLLMGLGSMRGGIRGGRGLLSQDSLMTTISTKSVVVTLVTAVALSLTALLPSPTMASPIGTLKSQQQSSFDTPTNKQVICGTVIAIDFGDDEFSVGYINPTTNEHELFPNDEGESSTASFVRIVDHLDGTQDVIIGKDAVLRPLDAREKAAADSRRLKQEQYYIDHPNTNFSLPVPEHWHEFRADTAYGMGWPGTVKIKYGANDMELLGMMDIEYGSSDLNWRLRSRMPSLLWNDEGERIWIGDEWGNISGMSLSSWRGGNQTGQCVRSPEEMDWKDERMRKGYEQLQVVTSLLLRRAKELAARRLQRENVKFAVVMIPSLTTNKRKRSLPESAADAAVRAGLEPVRVLDDSEAAVFAYEPMIAQAETLAGRPQSIVMYYLNRNTEGITVFQTFHDESEDKNEGFLQLKTVAKYHFYQSVKKRMRHAQFKWMFERYTAGEYHTDEETGWPDLSGPADDMVPPTHPIDFNSALRWIYRIVRPQWARKWGPETGDVQEKIYLSAFDYVLISHQEWWDFEREFLKTHYRNMLGRAYEKSGVKVEERPKKLDLLLVVDQSQFRNMSSAIMTEALGDGVKELYNPAFLPKHAASYGAARLAEYLTKQSSSSSCT
ncbi:hypothetical protein BGZ47_009758 [Haplosporangium gracile]|nr:hypothetical protein BGZ47_009758 [Haplosporangium gracile]